MSVLAPSELSEYRFPHDGILDLLNRSPSARESAASLIETLSKICAADLVDKQSTRLAAAKCMVHAQAIARFAKVGV